MQLAIHVTDVVRRLRQAGTLDPGQLAVSFVFRGPTLPGQPPESARPAVTTRIAAVSVRPR